MSAGSAGPYRASRALPQCSSRRAAVVENKRRRNEKKEAGTPLETPRECRGDVVRLELRPRP